MPLLPGPVRMRQSSQKRRRMRVRVRMCMRMGSMVMVVLVLLWGRLFPLRLARVGPTRRHARAHLRHQRRLRGSGEEWGWEYRLGTSEDGEGPPRAAPTGTAAEVERDLARAGALQGDQRGTAAGTRDNTVAEERCHWVRPANTVRTMRGRSVPRVVMVSSPITREQERRRNVSGLDSRWGPKTSARDGAPRSSWGSRRAWRCSARPDAIAST